MVVVIAGLERSAGALQEVVLSELVILIRSPLGPLSLQVRRRSLTGFSPLALLLHRCDAQSR